MKQRQSRIVFAGLLLLVACVTSADTVLVTGANSGIGLRLASGYAEQGWQVIATHRRDTVPQSLQVLAEKYPNVRVEYVDLADLDSIAALAGRLEGMPIDVLLNNAGVVNIGPRNSQNLESLDFEQFDAFLRINAMGQVMMVKAFLPQLKAGSQKKVAMISSTAGSITGAKQQPRSGAYWYRASKAALNMLSVSLAHDLKDDGIAVGIYHPGLVRVERNAEFLDRLDTDREILDPSESAAALMARIAELGPEQSGEFIAYDGSRLPY